MMDVKNNARVKFKISIALLLLFTSSICLAEHLSDIRTISKLDFTHGDPQITAPVSILADKLYTSNLDKYRFENYEVSIIDIENPEKCVFKVTNKNKLNSAVSKDINIEKLMPWWSSEAPRDLKKLDFSSVDGTSNSYNIGNNYRLTLLARQGHWGKVYLLERLSKSSAPKRICALKLVLSRSDLHLKKIEEFRKRHAAELQSNFIVRDWDIAIKPYGIIKRDEDRYLIFMEYGENAYQYFADHSLDASLESLYNFMNDVNKMHLSGYAHGDLKVENMLFVNNKIKLCDWYTLSDVKQTIVGKYRYFGDYLPPEAIRAFYFKDNTLKYSLVLDNNKQKSYFLHPIAADRFCLSISLLEILEPDLYQNFDILLSKDLNPWKPKSLDFWPKYIVLIKKTQNELLNRAAKMNNKKQRQLYLQLVEFLDVDPLKRNIHQ